jgi:tRNA (adenine-N(1)-)-methyltransferase non-catalytic subunit
MSSEDILVIKGDVMLLICSDKTRHFAVADGKSTVKLGKSNHVHVAAVTGTRYGSIFEVGKNKLVHLPNEEFLTRSESDSAALSEDAATSADNRHLSDKMTHQKLTPEDIAELKSGGASGQEIIAALVANSETWDGKTAFSQQKVSLPVA